MTKQEYEAKIEEYRLNPSLGLTYGIRNEYIASLETQNAQLTADNASLIQQVNECGVKYEKLIKKAALTLQNILGGQTPDWREWLEGGQE